MIRKNIQHLQLTKTLVHSNDQYTALVNQNLGFAAGFPPFLRGTTTTMYVTNPCQISHNPAFLTLELWNSHLKKTVATNTQPFIFSIEDTNDLIQTTDDLKIIFADLDLQNLIILVSASKKGLALLACLVAYFQEQNLLIQNILGIVQINPLDLLSQKNANIVSCKIYRDILDFSKINMPNFTSIQLMGFYDPHAVYCPAHAVAVTLAAAQEFLVNELRLGAKIDDLASKTSLVWSLANNAFDIVAKLRATRVLWAQMIKKLNPQHLTSMALQQHCEVTKPAVDTFLTIETLDQELLKANMALFGGAQSLKRNVSTVEASQYETRLFRDIQLFLIEEAKNTKTVDPWGGSFYIEKLTNEIITEALEMLLKIESNGGLSKAIQLGFLQDKNAIDYKSQSQTTEFLEALEKNTIISNPENLQNLIARLINGLKITAQDNLLELTIEAVKNGATINEIEFYFS